MGTFNFRSYDSTLNVVNDYSITHADIYGDMPTKTKIRIVNGFAYIGIFDGLQASVGGVSNNGNICIFKLDLSDGTFVKLFDGFDYWAGISGSFNYANLIDHPSNDAIYDDGNGDYIRKSTLDGAGWEGVIPIDFFVNSSGDIYTVHWDISNTYLEVPNDYLLRFVKCTAASGYTTFSVTSIGIAHTPPNQGLRTINARIIPITTEPDNILIASDATTNNGCNLWKFDGTTASNLAEDVTSDADGIWSSFLFSSSTAGWILSRYPTTDEMKLFSYASGVATLEYTYAPTAIPDYGNPFNKNLIGSSGNIGWQLMGHATIGYPSDGHDAGPPFFLAGDPCWPIYEVDGSQGWIIANVARWNGSSFELLIDRQTGRYNGGSIIGKLPAQSFYDPLVWRCFTLPNGNLIYTKLDAAFTWYGW